MKLNWGWGIAIFYSLFVIVMIGMVIMSSRQEINMVQDQYYEKDLNYESFRKSRQNASELVSKSMVTYDAGTKSISLEFPETLQKIQGEVTLYRPSSQSMDKKWPVQLNDAGVMQIKTEDLLPGLWRVLVDFKASGKSYYHEQVVVI